jgi:hypothetical protein
MNKKITLVFSIFFVILLASKTYAFCIDRTAPSAPTNLVIHDSPYDGDGNITLTWTAATDGPCSSSAVAYYKIYRSNDSVNFFLRGTYPTTTFNDFSSLPEGKYYYHVTAVDNVIDHPHEGPPVEGSTTVGQAPSTPSGGGGGTTGGGGGSVTGGTGITSTTGGGTTQTGGTTQSCTPNWSCRDWSACTDGKQTRICDDGCGDTKTETQNCEIPTLPVTQTAMITTPTGFFLGLTTADWATAVVAGIIIAIILIVLFRKGKSKK